MKKILLYLCLAAGLVSCAKELTPVIEDEPTGVPVTFNITVSEGETKASKTAWVENYNGSGVNGMILTSSINDAQLFFPAGGHKNDFGNGLSNYGTDGEYWSSSLKTDFASTGAWSFNPRCSSGSLPTMRVTGSDRCDGLLVRAVLD